MWKLWFINCFENAYLKYLNIAKNVFGTVFLITSFQKWKNIKECLTQGIFAFTIILNRKS